MVRIDSGLIEQVLLNLIDNAIRHTPETTQVSVSARMVGEAAEVEVRDDGPGLSDEALRHAFDRFFTGRAGTDSRRGLGLGLAICRSIVAAHGGTVRAENATTGGAVFTFTLPNATSVTDDDLTSFEMESDR
jgi:two-component system, OmpR family, sensor histidine kinase KdpD